MVIVEHFSRHWTREDTGEKGYSWYVWNWPLYHDRLSHLGDATCVFRIALPEW